MMKFSAVLVALVAFVCAVDAFTVQAPRVVHVRSSFTLQMTVLTYGTKKKDFKAGSPLKVSRSCSLPVCVSSRLFLSFLFFAAECLRVIRGQATIQL
jgi:hypothetical protein